MALRFKYDASEMEMDILIIAFRSSEHVTTTDEVSLLLLVCYSPCLPIVTMPALHGVPHHIFTLYLLIRHSRGLMPACSAYESTMPIMPFRPTRAQT